MPRIFLEVPYEEKDQAKALGARWDHVNRTWYIPAHMDALRFARWHPVVAQWVDLPHCAASRAHTGERRNSKK
jgi:hypothetical protein